MELTPQQRFAARRKYLSGLASAVGDLVESYEPQTPQKDTRSTLELVRQAVHVIDVYRGADAEPVPSGCMGKGVPPPRIDESCSASPISSPRPAGNRAP